MHQAVEIYILEKMVKKWDWNMIVQGKQANRLERVLKNMEKVLRKMKRVRRIKRARKMSRVRKKEMVKIIPQFEVN